VPGSSRLATDETSTFGYVIAWSRLSPSATAAPGCGPIGLPPFCSSRAADSTCASRRYVAAVSGFASSVSGNADASDRASMCRSIVASSIPASTPTSPRVRIRAAIALSSTSSVVAR
jgi:hypothetical protein